MKKLIALLILSLLGACATTSNTRQCQTPEVFFSKYGHVIECTEYATRDTKDRITQCYVEDESFKVSRKRLPTRSCW